MFRFFFFAALSNSLRSRSRQKNLTKRSECKYENICAVAATNVLKHIACLFISIVFLSGVYYAKWKSTSKNYFNVQMQKSNKFISISHLAHGFATSFQQQRRAAATAKERRRRRGRQKQNRKGTRNHGAIDRKRLPSKIRIQMRADTQWSACELSATQRYFLILKHNSFELLRFNGFKLSVILSRFLIISLVVIIFAYMWIEPKKRLPLASAERPQLCNMSTKNNLWKFISLSLSLFARTRSPAHRVLDLMVLFLFVDLIQKNTHNELKMGSRAKYWEKERWKKPLELFILIIEKANRWIALHIYKQIKQQPNTIIISLY